MIITEPIRIDIPITDSLHQRDVVLEECYLKLHDRYVEYKHVAEFEADDYHDSEGIWKATKANSRWTKLRNGITEVKMYHDNKEEKWQVAIGFMGEEYETGWLFQSPKEALVLYNQLKEYFITRP